MNATRPQIKRLDEETLASLENYTFPQILSKYAERLGEKGIAIREKAYGIWLTYTWMEYLRFTKRVALGLKSLGLQKGENVGLIVDNHPEWLFAELGAQSIGELLSPSSPQRSPKSSAAD